MTINTRNYKNGRKDYPYYPFYRWKRRMAYVVGKINGRIRNQGINALLTGNKKISADDTDTTKGKKIMN